MGIGVDSTVACPHCRGAIKPAAKICKHCRKSVERARDGALAPETPTAPLPSVLYELGVFLGGKKNLVDPAQVVRLLEYRDTNDASVLLRRLAAAGAITPIQADALVTEFHEHQMVLARSAIDSARVQKLIPPSYVEQALADYAPMAFTVSIEDHLVGTGLLTPQQATQLPASQATRSRKGILVAFALIGILVVLGAVVSARKDDAPSFAPPDDWRDHAIRRDGSKYLGVSFRLVDKQGNPTAADGRLLIALPRCISSIEVKASEFMPYRKGLLWGRKHIDLRPECHGGGSLAGTKIVMRFIQDKTEKQFTRQDFGVSFDSPPDDLPAASPGTVLVSE